MTKPVIAFKTKKGKFYFLFFLVQKKSFHLFPGRPKSETTIQNQMTNYNDPKKPSVISNFAGGQAVSTSLMEELYQKMVNEVVDYAILLLDRQGNILTWNQGATALKGYSEEEAIGQNFRMFYTDEDRQKKLPDELLKEADETGRSTREGWRVRKDGTLFWGSIVITALHDSDGNVIGFTKVTRDLTQKKEHEDYILRQNRLLAEYAHVASHDLQEPLRKLQLFSGMLRNHLDDPKTAETYLEKIEGSAKKMSIFIKDILRYARTESDSELMENVSLGEIMESVRDDMELVLETSNATVEWHDLPTVWAVPVQMHQLFTNLIHNAVKFSDKPPVIRIAAEIVPSMTGQKVRITVTDNGVGFDPQYADQIFGMFQRLQHVKMGTGIGLALCRRIAEGHGGTITATSTPGVGSVFVITLPLPVC